MLLCFCDIVRAAVCRHELFVCVNCRENKASAMTWEILLEHNKNVLVLVEESNHCCMLLSKHDRDSIDASTKLAHVACFSVM